MRHISLAALTFATLAVTPLALAQADNLSVWMDVIDPHASAYAQLIADATVAASEGQVDRALAYLDEASALRPDRTDAVYFSLQVLFDAGRNELLLERCAALQAEWAPSEPDADAVVAFFEALGRARMGELAEAAAALETAVRFRHDLHDAPLYFSNLGELHAALGDYPRAITFYQQALSASSSYHLARMGLAAVYTRMGRDAEARREALTVATEDASLSFLTAPGLFFLEPGQGDLYRLLLAEAVGDYAEAHAALSELRLLATHDSPLAALVSRVETRLSEDLLGQWRIMVPGCVVSGFALSPNGDRAAVACSDRVVEGPLPDDWRSQPGEVTGMFTRISAPLLNDGYSIYDLTDVAYTADQSTLRILYRSGVVESVSLEDPATPVETVRYDAGNTPASFAEDAERVVFSDMWGSSVIIADWDDTSQTNGTSWSSGLSYIYPYCIRVSADGTGMTVFDGYNLTLGTGPSFGQIATHPFYDSGGCPFALDPQAETVAILNSQVVTLYDAQFQPIGLVRVPSSPDAYYDYYSVVVRYVDERLLGVGSYDHIMLLEMPASGE